jgi:hypothetical protein
MLLASLEVSCARVAVLISLCREASAALAPMMAKVRGQRRQKIAEIKEFGWSITWSTLGRACVVCNTASGRASDRLPPSNGAAGIA